MTQVQQLNLDKLQVFELELFKASNIADANQLLTQYFSQFDIQAFAFTFYTRHPSSVNKIKYDYASKQARRWHEYYLAQNYNDFDQTVDQLHASSLPIIWDLQEQLSKAKSETEKTIRQESTEFGIEKGVSIPLFGPNSHYASFVFYQMQGECWLENYASIKYELILVANLYFNFVMQYLHKLKTPEQNKRNGNSSSNSSADAGIQLTVREQQCLVLTAQNYSAKQVAEKINVTKRTVEFHLNNLNKKLGVKNKFQAVNKAIELGLVDL